MGPGVLGQFVGGSSDQIQECLNCHAPLWEQADSLQKFFKSEMVAESHYSEEQLHSHGVMCSACHMRNGRWYGPPRKQGLPPPDPKSNIPHWGWTTEVAFEDPMFCAPCHQFPETGYALNGKLIENTIEEWKASDHAARGTTCQHCHMPSRRHLWRGIHDADMVRAGVRIETRDISTTCRELTASLSITNNGTGHFFPSYVTPSVVLEIYQEDARGMMLDETRQDLVIARDVSLDLSIEYSDTRLAPQETAVLTYTQDRSPTAVTLVLRVRVEPDAFYARFYKAMLESELDYEARKLIERALAETDETPFVLFEERFNVTNTSENTDSPYQGKALYP